MNTISSTWTRLFFSALMGVCLFFLLPVATCHAAGTTITVNSVVSNAGTCVLTDAITAANTNTTTNGCVSGTGGPFTIVFTPTLAGDSYVLGSTLPTITNNVNLTITGPTASSTGMTISGNFRVPIMIINSGATVTLQNLTFFEGYSSPPTPDGTSHDGGAIHNDGTLTITNCTLSSNQANGGANTGSGPGGSGYGGAIFNGVSATLTITNSTLSSNMVGGGGSFPPAPGGDGDGGALYNNGGTVTITNVTFSGNEAYSAGTGQGQGGAIANFGGGTVTVTNATFSGNQATIYGAGGANGGAIFASSSGTNIVNLKGTILAANTAASNSNNCNSSVTATPGYNIADDGTCFTNGTNNNVVVPNTSDIGLASGLADNHGGTETIALKGSGGGGIAPSAVANTLIPIANCTDQSSPPVTLATDQRGVSRPQPSHPTTCSAGAYEYNPLFFYGQVVSGSLYYLTFPNTTFFGYYSYQYYPNIYQYDLGFEYVVDPNDGLAGIQFWDNSLGEWLYTNPSEYPYFWDYASSSWLYYYAGTARNFYEFGGAGRGYFFSPPS
ncbi:MAG: choice-of-anchor Q domain-containing protein [Candidatus Binataceae bacterium]